MTIPMTRCEFAMMMSVAVYLKGKKNIFEIEHGKVTVVLMQMVGKMIYGP